MGACWVVEGWLLFELPAGWILLLWCGSKEARASSTRIRSACHGQPLTGRQSKMIIMIGIDPHKATHTGSVALIDQGARLFDPVSLVDQIASATSSKAAARRRHSLLASTPSS